MNDSLIIPQWQTSSNVGAVMTTRKGGVSAPPFDSLNFGDNTSDNPHSIVQNKQYLQTWVKSCNHNCEIPLAFLDQVHGTHILNLDDSETRQAVISGVQPQADASYTMQAGMACVVRGADCMPVLFSAPGIVAAVHAGWRGLASGIIEKTVALLTEKTSCAPEQIHAWLGPCIGPDVFEVGSEVRDAFVTHSEENQLAFKAPHTSNKWLANLSMLAQFTLKRSAVKNVCVDARCTYENEHLFFSYRRDQARLGGTGRMAACIWLKE